MTGSYLVDLCPSPWSSPRVRGEGMQLRRVAAADFLARLLRYSKMILSTADAPRRRAKSAMLIYSVY